MPHTIGNVSNTMHFYSAWKSPFFLSSLFKRLSFVVFLSSSFLSLVAFCCCFVEVMFLFYLSMPLSWHNINVFQKYVCSPRDDILFPPFAIFLTGLLFSICSWTRGALSRFAVCHRWDEWGTMGTVLYSHGWQWDPLLRSVVELVHVHCSQLNS